MERLDRFRQRHGVEPHGASTQHRRGDDCGCDGRSVEKDHGRSARRNPRAEEHDQHDGRSTPRVRYRSDARRARSRNGRKARRTSGCTRRGRHVERPHRLRQLDGVESHRPGAQHRRGDDRGRERRPVAQDHRRREGRNPRAEEHDQHDGRSAQCLRRRGDARRPRSRHRRQARRPSAGAGCRRHLEGFDRYRQRHGGKSDRAGARHRQSGDGCRRRRPQAEPDGGLER